MDLLFTSTLNFCYLIQFASILEITVVFAYAQLSC